MNLRILLGEVHYVRTYRFTDFAYRSRVGAGLPVVDCYVSPARSTRAIPVGDQGRVRFDLPVRSIEFTVRRMVISVRRVWLGPSYCQKLAIP